MCQIKHCLWFRRRFNKAHFIRNAGKYFVELTLDLVVAQELPDGNKKSPFFCAVVLNKVSALKRIIATTETSVQSWTVSHQDRQKYSIVFVVFLLWGPLQVLQKKLQHFFFHFKIWSSSCFAWSGDKRKDLEVTFDNYDNDNDNNNIKNAFKPIWPQASIHIRGLHQLVKIGNYYL